MWKKQYFLGFVILPKIRYKGTKNKIACFVYVNYICNKCFGMTMIYLVLNLKNCEGMENVVNAYGSKKNAGSAIFTSDKIDFKHTINKRQRHCSD